MLPLAVPAPVITVAQPLDCVQTLCTGQAALPANLAGRARSRTITVERARRMDELGRRVGMLRLLLADLTARHEQTEALQGQLRSQIERLVEFTVQRNAIVSNALAAMAEIDERLIRAEADLRHIEMLRRRAQDELDALLVTRGIADARARLAELERQAAELRSAPDAAGETDGEASGELAEIAAEMAELRSTIDAASGAAARHLAERTERREQREQ